MTQVSNLWGKMSPTFCRGTGWRQSFKAPIRVESYSNRLIDLNPTQIPSANGNYMEDSSPAWGTLSDFQNRRQKSQERYSRTTHFTEMATDFVKKEEHFARMAKGQRCDKATRVVQGSTSKRIRGNIFLEQLRGAWESTISSQNISIMNRLADMRKYDVLLAESQIRE